MLGAYITHALVIDVKLPLYAMIPVAFLSFAAVGLLFMLFIYMPLRKASYLASITIATIGMSIVLKELVTIIWAATHAHGTPF